MSLYSPQKIVAVLPFCRIYGHMAKPFAAPCRYAAKAAMRQNCLSCCAYLPITYAYIPLQKCRRFAVFTATAKPLAAPCSYAAKTDNAAELSAMPCRFSRKEGEKKKTEGKKRARKKRALHKKNENRGRFQKKKKGGQKEGTSKNTGKTPEKHSFQAKIVSK